MLLLPAGSFVYGDLKAIKFDLGSFPLFEVPTNPTICEGGIRQSGLSESQLNMGLKS